MGFSRDSFDIDEPPEEEVACSSVSAELAMPASTFHISADEVEPSMWIAILVSMPPVRCPLLAPSFSTQDRWAVVGALSGHGSSPRTIEALRCGEIVAHAGYPARVVQLVDFSIFPQILDS